MFLFCAGCGFKIIGLLGTPARHEREIPAEYDLTKHGGQKLLVLVNQPGWLGAKANLRYHLTEAINKALTAKIEIPTDSLISYDKLSEFRSGNSNFSLLSTFEVGAAFDANMVLLVAVEDYQLNEVPETDYYRGLLNVKTVLLDVTKEEKLWPESEESKSIKVGFEVEQRGKEIAIKRLAAAVAHCAVRHFYDCPKNKFKIPEDRSRINWEN